MTSGTKTQDFSRTVSMPARTCFDETTQSQTIGIVHSKTYSGGNSAFVPFPARQLLDFSYPVYSKSGQYLRTKVRLVWYPSGRRKKRLRLTENNYTAAISYSDDGVMYRSIECAGTPYKGVRTSLLSTRSYSGIFPYPNLGSEEVLAIYGKLRSRIGASFNAAVALGEGRESLRTITQSATKIYKAWKALKRGRIHSALNELLGARGKRRSFTDKRNFADNWLQIRYGWIPLLNDIKNACEHLAFMQNRPVTMQHRVRSKVGFTGKYPGDPRYTISNESRLQVIAKITSVNELKLAGLMNPASVAWELLPLSFVVDWFIPVSATLEALALQGAITAKYTTTTTLDRRSSCFSSKGGGVTTVGFFDHRDLNIDRKVSSSLPQIRPPWKADLTKDLDWKKAVTAVSLIIQKMK